MCTWKFERLSSWEICYLIVFGCIFNGKAVNNYSLYLLSKHTGINKCVHINHLLWFKARSVCGYCSKSNQIILSILYFMEINGTIKSDIKKYRILLTHSHHPRGNVWVEWEWESLCSCLRRWRPLELCEQLWTQFGIASREPRTWISALHSVQERWDSQLGFS